MTTPKKGTRAERRAENDITRSKFKLELLAFFKVSAEARGLKEAGHMTDVFAHQEIEKAEEPNKTLYQQAYLSFGATLSATLRKLYPEDETSEG